MVNCAGIERVFKGKEDFWNTVRMATSLPHSVSFSSVSVVHLCAHMQYHLGGNAGLMAEKLFELDSHLEVSARLYCHIVMPCVWCRCCWQRPWERR